MKWKEHIPALGAPLLAAAILAIASVAFNDLHALRASEELHTQLTTLLPGSTSFTHKAGEGGEVLALYEGSGGTVAQVRVKGYIYDVEMLVAVDTRGRVTGLVVRDAHETLGLGNAILRDYDFLSRFLKTEGQAEIGKDIQPITGATVSSRAVSRCVSAAVAAVTGVDVPSQATPWGDAP